jgi:hypothetical protein
VTSSSKVIHLLQEELTRIRAKNPSYSLRAFARKLKLPPSALSGILNGKLTVTRRTGEKVLQRLGTDPMEIQRILSDLKLRTPRIAGAKPTRYLMIDMDQFHLLADWYPLAVLSLMSTEASQSNPRWIAKKLGIQIREAKSALDRLKRLGLVTKKDGKLIPSDQQFQTTTDIPNVYIRRYHLKNLELAQRAMEEDSFSSCDFSSMTMAIDPAKLPEAKSRIRDFRRSLCEFMETGNQKQVYRMSVQLFPLSDRKENKP